MMMGTDARRVARGMSSGEEVWRMGKHHTLSEETLRDARQWDARHVGVVTALWVAGAIALALLSVAAHTHDEFPGDLGLTLLLQHLNGTPLAPIITFASDANWPTPAGITAVAVILALAALRQFRAAIATAISGFGADLANVTLNGLVARPRPHNAHIQVVAQLGLHSFPSGHVTHVIALYGFLFYVSHRVALAHPAWHPWLRAVQAICLYFMIAIGPARVLLGEHWPSDVLASYILGALVLAIGIAVYHLLALAWVAREEHAHGGAQLAGR
jgi:membrane-associated phospholipid phosphatase